MTFSGSTAEAKAAARKSAFVRRKSAQGLHGAAPATAVASVLTALVRAQDGPISGYLPIRTEIDPVPVMESLIALGRRVCVPVVAGPARPLRFREWTPDTKLIQGPFGVDVPHEGAWVDPVAMIVPMLAFDAQLRRLGYGGGFYDRTIESLRLSGPLLAIGYAYSAQFDAALPYEPTDQALDAIVTETGVRLPKPREEPPR